MEYYIQFNGQTIGPMTKEQIGAYGVTRDTPVSANGGDWKPLFTYPELMQYASKIRQCLLGRFSKTRMRNPRSSDRRLRNTVFPHWKNYGRNNQYPSLYRNLRIVDNREFRAGDNDSLHE